MGHTSLLILGRDLMELAPTFGFIIGWGSGWQEMPMMRPGENNK